MKRAASRKTPAALAFALLLAVLLLSSGCIQSLNFASGVEAGPSHTISMHVKMPQAFTDSRGTLAFRIPNGWTIISVSYSGAVSGAVHYSGNIANYFKTTWEAKPIDSLHNGHKLSYGWWAGYTDTETVSQDNLVTVTILIDTHDISGSFLLDFVTGLTDNSSPSDPSANNSGGTWESGNLLSNPPGVLLNQAMTLTPATVPTVLSSNPANSAIDVPIGAGPAVTFSEAMDADWINDSHVELFPEGSASHVAATVAYNATDHRATLQPTLPLLYGTTYDLRVDKNVKDLAGHIMAADFEASFTTVSPAAPHWTVRTPDAGSTDQPLGTNVTVVFDQNMNAATISDANLSLKKSGVAAPLAATVSYSVATRTAILDPSVDLEADTVYEVTLTTAVQNLTGQSVKGAPIVWSFRTKAAVPSFTDVTPGNPYYAAIQGMAAAGLIGGYPQPGGSSLFKPDDPVWRAQFAKMVVGALGLAVSDGMTSPFTDLGPDVPGELYPHAYVAAAFINQITTGTSPTTFSPWESVSRAQVVTMVVRALQNLHPDALQPVPGDYVNTWGTDFSPVHGPNARIAESNGLLDGLPLTGAANNPWAPMSRGEVAQVLWNTMVLIE